MGKLLQVVIIGALLGAATTAEARLAANRLAANRLGSVSAAANSSAASRLAEGKLAVSQIGPNEYAINADAAAELLATDQGQEVLAFIVSCALPEGTTLVSSGPGVPGYVGELGLAPEWLDHPLRESGRGWVSACLFARVNANDVPIPISLRGNHPALASTPEEEESWSLEEGAYFGDYFASPSEGTFSWNACIGEDQAVMETGGLIERDCSEPDLGHPGLTLCGFHFAGACGDFAQAYACKHFSPRGYYRSCNDQPGKANGPKVFKEVITVYDLGL